MPLNWGMPVDNNYIMKGAWIITFFKYTVLKRVTAFQKISAVDILGLGHLLACPVNNMVFANDANTVLKHKIRSKHSPLKRRGPASIRQCCPMAAHATGVQRL